MLGFRLPNALNGRGRATREVALAGCAGALAIYSQPGTGVAIIMPFAAIALAFLAARGQSYSSAARIGLSWGVGCFGVLTIASREWALIVPMALTFIGACLYGLPQALWARYLARRPYDAWAFVATVAFWSLEMELSDAVGFPTKIESGAALVGAPLLLGGVRLFGSSVWCGIMTAGTLGCALRLAQPSRPGWAHLVNALRPMLAALALLGVTSALGRALAPAATGTVTVGVPQMNVPSAYFTHRLGVPQLTDAFEDVFADQVQSLAGVDVLALTETFDGAYPLQAPRVRERFENYARIQHQAVLLTSYLASPDDGVFNAVGAIDADGKLVGIHRKVNLAPFGEVEYEHASTFRPEAILPGVRAGILICQEALLTEGPQALVHGGANLLVTHTSDISFGSGLLGFDHLAVARLRAIEVGRAMVWASAGGSSGAIDRWGAFEHVGPFRAPAAVRMKAELFDDLTVYARSYWFWRVLAAIAVVGFVLKRRNSAPRPDTSASAAPIATWRGALELVLALAFVWTASIASAGAVELANGTPERAKRSMNELLHHTERYLGGETLARFHSKVPDSASAAVAYFLDWYGQRTLPTDAPVSVANPTLQDLSLVLRRDHEFPTRSKLLNFQAPPRVAAIVRTKAGEFCVITSDRAHRIWLFAPSEGSVREVAAARAQAELEPMVLVPAGDVELGQPDSTTTK